MPACTYPCLAVVKEAGHAYEDVDEVMRNSAGLVEPVSKLRPLGVLKG